MVRVFNQYMPIPNLVLAAVDATMFVVAIYGGLYLRWENTPALSTAIENNLGHAVVFVTVLSVMMFSVGLYERQVWNDWANLIARIIVGFLLSFLFLSLIFYMFPGTAVWRSALVVAIGLAMLASILVRVVYFQVANLDAFKRKILVLGAGDYAERVQALERDNKPLGTFECTRFIKINGGDVKIDSKHLISGVNNLADYVSREGIEEIVVAVDDRRGRMPVQALLDCKLSGVAVTDFHAFYEREAGRIDLGRLNPSFIIFSGGLFGDTTYRTMKRIFDITVSLLAIVFMFPLLVATAIAIMIDSRGPVFYHQERVGHRGNPFQLLKFRSMRVDAEKDNEPRWAVANDDRVTRVGKCLRRTRIDEIPQLYNVLIGSMSLVGPRPERPIFVEQLGKNIPFYLERHYMKPGLTGWAQINYKYTASIEDAKFKTEYDLYYVKNHSFLLDLIIVLKTLRVIIWPQAVH